MNTSGILGGVFRTSGLAIVAAIGLIAVAMIAPQQLPVFLWKGVLLLAAAWVGYWVDRHLFPYARPDILQGASSFDAACLRRAIVVAAAMLSVGLAL